MKLMIAIDVPDDASNSLIKETIHHTEKSLNTFITAYGAPEIDQCFDIITPISEAKIEFFRTE